MENQFAMDMEMEIEQCRNKMAEGAFGDNRSGIGLFQQPQLLQETMQCVEPKNEQIPERDQKDIPIEIEVDEEEEKRFDEARALYDNEVNEEEKRFDEARALYDNEVNEEKSDREVKQIEDELTELMKQLDIGKNTNTAQNVDEFNVKMQNVMEHYCQMESKIIESDSNKYVKKQMKVLREEIEELHRALIEKTQQMQEYQIKFLTCDARTINLLKCMDLLRAKYAKAKSIQEEIKKNKNHFERKLLELAPLPEVLSRTQLELEKSMRLHKLAEDYAQKLTYEIIHIAEKYRETKQLLSTVKIEHENLIDEMNSLKSKLSNKEDEIRKLQNSNEKLTALNTSLEEKLNLQDKIHQDKLEEYKSLCATIEEFQVEKDNSLKRHRERNEAMRKALHVQVNELEKLLVQERAQCSELSKDRNNLRQIIQVQVNTLKKHSILMEGRIHTLLSQLYDIRNAYRDLFG